jgi:hypothetical protein
MDAHSGDDQPRGEMDSLFRRTLKVGIGVNTAVFSVVNAIIPGAALAAAARYFCSTSGAF